MLGSNTQLLNRIFKQNIIFKQHLGHNMRPGDLLVKVVENKASQGTYLKTGVYFSSSLCSAGVYLSSSLCVLPGVYFSSSVCVQLGVYFSSSLVCSASKHIVNLLVPLLSYGWCGVLKYSLKTTLNSFHY